MSDADRANLRIAASLVTDDKFGRLWDLTPERQREYLANIVRLLANPSTRSNNLERLAKGIDGLKRRVGTGFVDDARALLRLTDMTSTLAAKVDPNFTQNIELVGMVALALLVPGPEDVVLGQLGIKLARMLALRIGGRVAASLAERFAKISTLGIGSNVLAFNQQTQAQGSYTVTATHKKLDPKVTYLTLKTHNNKRELIETTPEHPFMMNKGWVLAGKLHVGDKVREKGGYYGAVEFNKTIDRTQTMYNLTVAFAQRGGKMGSSSTLPWGLRLAAYTSDSPISAGLIQVMGSVSGISLRLAGVSTVPIGYTIVTPISVPFSSASKERR